MPQFTFHQNYGTTDITHTFEADHLDDVILQFQAFLKGCQFVFDGDLQIVEGYDIMSCEKNALEESQEFPYTERRYRDEHICSVCGIEKNIMNHHQCFDRKCPKGSW
jgi:hypothetical protein